MKSQARRCPRGCPSLCVVCFNFIRWMFLRIIQSLWCPGGGPGLYDTREEVPVSMFCERRSWSLLYLKEGSGLYDAREKRAWKIIIGPCYNTCQEALNTLLSFIPSSCTAIFHSRTMWHGFVGFSIIVNIGVFLMKDFGVRWWQRQSLRNQRRFRHDLF